MNENTRIMRGLVIAIICCVVCSCSKEKPAPEVVLEMEFYKGYDINKYEYKRELGGLDEAKRLIFGAWSPWISDEELARMPGYKKFAEAYNRGRRVIVYSSSNGGEWVAAYDGLRFESVESLSIGYDNEEAVDFLTVGQIRFTEKAKDIDKKALGLEKWQIELIEPVYSLGVILGDLYEWRSKYRSLEALQASEARKHFIESFRKYQVAWRVTFNSENILYVITDGERPVARLSIAYRTDFEPKLVK